MEGIELFMLAKLGLLIVGKHDDLSIAYDKVGRDGFDLYSAGREIDELAHKGQDIYGIFRERRLKRTI